MMPDREKIINAIEKAKKQSEEYALDRIIVPFKEADIILALLKEQGDTINELQNAYRYLQKQFFEVQDELLNQKTDELLEQKTEWCERCGRVRLKSSRIAESR